MKLWLKFDSSLLDFSAPNICPSVLTSVIFSREATKERTQIPLVPISGCALRQIRAADSLAARQILLNSLRKRERLIVRRISSYAASASESALGIILGEYPRVCLPRCIDFSLVLAGLPRRYKSKERERELVIDVLQIHRVRARKFGILFRQFEPNPAFNI